MVSPISRDELKRRIDSRAVTVVEALPEEQFEEAHLPGALNMPHDRVAELAPTVLPDKNGAIAVYCADLPCANSGVAAAKLQALGYTDVVEYREGKEDWVEAGLPVERGLVRAQA